MNDVSTIPQCKSLIEIFENLKPRQLNSLLVSGLLTDLRSGAEITDLNNVNRDTFRKALGIDSYLFRVRMGGPESTDEITSSLGFPFNEWINQYSLPLTSSETQWQDEIEIMDPECTFSESQGLSLLGDVGLEAPTYEHVLRFAQQFGKLTTSEVKPNIAFLTKSWSAPDNRPYTLCLNRTASFRRLYLHCSYHSFLDGFVIAGVRQKQDRAS